MFRWRRWRCVTANVQVEEVCYSQGCVLHWVSFVSCRDADVHVGEGILALVTCSTLQIHDIVRDKNEGQEWMHATTGQCGCVCMHA